MNGVRIPRECTQLEFDAAHPAVAAIDAGERITFETVDARAGEMFVHEPGRLVDLPRPSGRGNRITGPLDVRGAQPGDALVVTIDEIRWASDGWVGAHAHVHPASTGRIPRSLARVCALRDGRVEFSERLSFPQRPLIGTIGTAPAGPAAPCGLPGRHGGNLDHPLVGLGARLYLPVSVTGGWLYVGDVHAAQGNGELSGVAVEAAADVVLHIGVMGGAGLDWPWVETEASVAVLACGATFDDARRACVDAALDLLVRRLALEPAEALALLSAVGDLQIGQAFGGMEVTLALALPRSLGVGIGP
jgi:amidase